MMDSKLYIYYLLFVIYIYINEKSQLSSVVLGSLWLTPINKLSTKLGLILLTIVEINLKGPIV